MPTTVSTIRTGPAGTPIIITLGGSFTTSEVGIIPVSGVGAGGYLGFLVLRDSLTVGSETFVMERPIGPIWNTIQKYRLPVQIVASAAVFYQPKNPARAIGIRLFIVTS